MIDISKRFKSFQTERFHKNYIKGKDDECWIWTGDINKKKTSPYHYGVFVTKQLWKTKSRKKKSIRVLAHRLAFYLAHGAFDWNLHVLHKCDNGLCVNPAHLFLGTNLDNVMDKVKKADLSGEEIG